MNKEELYHWQDSVEETQQCDAVFEKFKAAGLLDELKFIVEKKMTDARSDEAYQQANFSG